MASRWPAYVWRYPRSARAAGRAARARANADDMLMQYGAAAADGLRAAGFFERAGYPSFEMASQASSLIVGPVPVDIVLDRVGPALEDPARSSKSKTKRFPGSRPPATLRTLGRRDGRGSPDAAQVDRETTVVRAATGMRPTGVMLPFRVTADDAVGGTVELKALVAIRGARDANPDDNSSLASVRVVR